MKTEEKNTSSNYNITPIKVKIQAKKICLNLEI